MAGDGEGQGQGQGQETPDERETLRLLVAQVRTNLATRGRSGLLGVSMKPSAPKKAASVVPVAPPVLSPLLPVVSSGPPEPDAAEGEPGLPAAPGAPRGRAGLELVRDELGDCKRCKLCPSRQNIVFGVGNPDAPLVFVGEAPGADEDAHGGAVRRHGRAAAHQDDRGDGLRARRRLHLQHPQMPAARQPQPRARRGRRAASRS